MFFSLSSDLARPHNQRVDYTLWVETVLGQSVWWSVKFGGHRHCGSGNMFLVFM